MSHNLFSDANLHAALLALDIEIALVFQKAGCQHCKGRLDVSDYPRKPRGVPVAFRDLYTQRLSFSCARCRRRCTPPSVRFFGRIRSVAGQPVLIAALTRGPSERRCAQLQQCFGIRISVSTWQRWRRWWREQFITTRFWRQRRGLFPTPTHVGCLPGGFFRVITGTLIERILQALLFLSPLSIGHLQDL